MKTQPDVSSIKSEFSKGKTSSKTVNNLKTNKKIDLQQNDLRNKLIKRYKSTKEQELQKQKKRLEKTRDKSSWASILLLTGAGKGSSTNSRSPSINSISSNDSILSDPSKSTGPLKKRKKKKKKRTNSTSSNSSSSSSSSSTKSSTPSNSGNIDYNCIFF